MSLVTPSQVIARALPSLDDTAENQAVLQPLVDAAEDLIATFLGYPKIAGVSSLEVTDYVHFCKAQRADSSLVLLPVGPVSAVATVHDSTAWEYDASSLVDAADYVLEGPVWALRTTRSAGHTWTAPEGQEAARAIRVSYSAGYANAPPKLAQAIALYVRHLYHLGHVGGSAVIADAGRTDTLRDETLPASVRQLVYGLRLGSVHYAT